MQIINICADVCYTIFEFLNLNDLRLLLITTTETSKMVQKMTHYKECLKYGKLDTKEHFPTIIRKGNFYICKYILRINENINIHVYSEHAFELACAQGHFQIVKWLVGLEQTYGKINIHADNECAFRGACREGHLAIAQWLIELEATHDKINIHAEEDYAFD